MIACFTGNSKHIAQLMAESLSDGITDAAEPTETQSEGTEAPQENSDPAPGNEFPWWIVIATVAILLGIIIVVIKKKK